MLKNENKTINVYFYSGYFSGIGKLFYKKIKAILKYDYKLIVEKTG